MENLRILYSTARYYPDMGGTETHVYEVAHRLVDRAESVTVLTTDRSLERQRESVVDGVRIVRVPAYPRQQDYYWSPALAKYILDNQHLWDIVHVQGYHNFASPLGMWAAGRARLPYVLTYHSGGHTSGIRNAIRPLQARLQRPLMAKAARLIGVSDFEADQFSRWTGVPRERFVVIPNGASLKVVDPTYQPEPSHRDMILSVGRLEKYKGHQHVIQAMPHVLHKRSQARLRILGVGPYEESLKALVNKLGLEDSVEVTFIPPENRTGMAEALLSSGLVVLFSEYEAHPVAVMEAVAMNCSVLVADTTGLSELARKNLVKAIPLSSTTAELADAIVQQLQHPFRPESITLPNWNDCAEQLYQLYLEVIDSR